MSTQARRLSIAARVLAAVVGGYAAAGLATVAISRWLPLSKAEATHVATLLSFVIYVAIVLAVFHASTARHAWLLIASICVVATLSAYVAGRTP